MGHGHSQEAGTKALCGQKQAPRKETLEEKFERLMSEPVSAPIGKLTKREARYFLRKLAGSDPDSPWGVEVLREFRG